MKRVITGEALQPGVNVPAVARRHGIKPGLLFRWRKLALKQAKPSARAGVPAGFCCGAIL